MAIFVKVVKARRTEEGIIIHKLDNGEEKKYLAVRGGLSWPLVAKNLPGCFCIYGEEWIHPVLRKQGQRGKLTFMEEHEEPNVLSLNALCAKAFSSAILFWCGTFYAATEGEDYKGYVKDFRESIYKKQQELMNGGRPAISLVEAPYANSPKDGLRHINDWYDNALLELPEGSLVRKQLKMAEGEKIDQLPETLNMVNALRFLVCGFNEYRPNPTPENWRDRAPKGTWRTG